MTSDMRLIWRASRNETNSIAAMAGSVKMICLVAKWKLSRPMRSATAGLAAKDSTMPSPISVRNPARNHRSTVHHQVAIGLLSRRLGISAPLRSVEPLR